MPALRRILIVGRSGQVATALRQAPWPSNYLVESLGRDVLDLSDSESVRHVLGQAGWHAVVNAAAYTHVDRAESEPELAFAVNRDGPAALASGCAREGIPLIHLSSDYVFDGTKDGPYTEHDAPRPLSVYGASKAAGEDAVRTRLDAHVILRTSWVFSSSGRNFVTTMLQRAAERSELAVVDDHQGRPSAASDIANAVVRIATALLDGKTDGFGTLHFAGAGATTWFGFAEEIFAQASLRGFRPVPRLVAIPTTAYPTPAQRPLNSVLATGRIATIYGIEPRPWQHGLSETLDALRGPKLTSAAPKEVR
jgi:dTDP-4-dehydrorhamnose reductase